MEMPKIKHHQITITQEIIDKADKETTRTCMVAIAIREQIAGSHSVAVDASSIKFNVKDDNGQEWRYKYDTPGKVGVSISQFDDDPDKVEPFKFKLDARQGTVGQVRPRKQFKGGTPKTKRECIARCSRRYHGVVMTADTSTSKDK